jgi:hypothetical protein
MYKDKDVMVLSIGLLMAAKLHFVRSMVKLFD